MIGLQSLKGMTRLELAECIHSREHTKEELEAALSLASKACQGFQHEDERSPEGHNKLRSQTVLKRIQQKLSK